MTYILPRLTVGLLCLAGSWLRGQCSLAEKAEVVADQGVESESNSLAEPRGVLLAAIDELARRPAISARLRQRINLFEREISGSGEFLQGPAESNWLRFVLKFQTGSNASTFEQTCDGNWLWTRRQSPLSPASVTRVDTRRVIQERAKGSRRGSPARQPPDGSDGAMDSEASLDENDVLSSPPMLGFGGLSRLLINLDSAFEFAEITEGELGDMRTLEVRGGWRRESLAKFFPEKAAEIQAGQAIDVSGLPAAVPDQVRLTLGKEDRFPYRLEYCRLSRSKDRRAASAEGTPLVVMEFFDVEFDAELDETMFEFDPGFLKVVDETELFLARTAK